MGTFFKCSSQIQPEQFSKYIKNTLKIVFGLHGNNNSFF